LNPDTVTDASTEELTEEEMELLKMINWSHTATYMFSYMK